MSLVELGESKAKDPMAQLKARTAASAVGPSDLRKSWHVSTLELFRACKMIAPQG